MRYYVGFSITRRNFVSSIIRIFTKSDVSHVFLIVVSKRMAKVYHVDGGQFEIIDLDKFFAAGREVKRLYEVPVWFKIRATKALLWFSLQRNPAPTAHVVRMAYEWLFRVNIESHRIRYCTQAIAEFLRRAVGKSMVEATYSVVSPGSFEAWMISNGWKNINGRNHTIDADYVRTLARTGGAA